MADLSRGIAVFEAAADVPADAEVLGVPVFADGSLPEGAGATLDQSFLSRCGFEGQAGPGPGGAGRRRDSGGGAGGRRPRRCRCRRGAAGGSGPGPPPVAYDGCGHDARPGRRRGRPGRGCGRGDRPRRLPLRDGSRHLRRGRAASGPQQVVVVGGDADQVRFGSASALATVRARDWVNEPAGTLTPSAWPVSPWSWAGGTASTSTCGTRTASPPSGSGAWAGWPPGRGRTGPPAPPVLPAAGRRGAVWPSSARASPSTPGGCRSRSAASMMTMKSDMGGAAAVIATMAAAAELALPVRITGWVASTENMPGGTRHPPRRRPDHPERHDHRGAQHRRRRPAGPGRRPGPGCGGVRPTRSWTSPRSPGRSGWRSAPGVAAVLGNDDDLVAAVLRAGERAGEPAWRLPLVAAYRSRLDSDVADLKNVAYRCGRRRHHGRPGPRRVRRRSAVGPSRHRLAQLVREQRRLADPGGDGLGGEDAVAADRRLRRRVVPAAL